VAALNRDAGLAPDPEQEMALDALFAVRPDRRSAAFEFANICARQNMKTALLKMAVLGWLFVTEEELIVWSAHEMSTTREAFRDLENLIKGYSPFRSRLPRTPTEGFFHSNAELLIELASGQRVKFKARTAGGGRGLTGDKVILDEAMYLEPPHMDALLPTLTAVRNPQVCYAGSAGLLKSEVLRGIRDRGRAGTDPALAYLEWCAPGGWDKPPCRFGSECAHVVGTPGCALDDPELRRPANPALGRRIMPETLATFRRALTPMGFGRECLGWWEDPPPEDEASELAKAKARWPDLADEGAPEPAGRIALALDVPRDRSSSSIAAAWRLGQRVMVMVTKLPGTAEAVATVAALASLHRPVDIALHTSGPAGGLLKPLEDKRVTVRPVSTQELARDTGTFLDLVVNSDPRARTGLGHLNQSELNAPLAVAKLRDAGDASVWDIKDGADLSPLRAATVAVAALIKFGGGSPGTPLVDLNADVSETSWLDRAGF
jgi:hypothetical protein